MKGLERLERAIKELRTIGKIMKIDNIENIIRSRIVNTIVNYFGFQLGVCVDWIIDDDIICGDNIGGYYEGIVYLNSECTKDINELILTIGHECRHAWQEQIAKDMFNVKEYIHYNGDNLEEYFNQPMEKDAYSFEDNIDKDVIISLITKALEN